MKLSEEIIAALSGTVINEDDLPVGDPFTQKARTCSNMFTDGVNALRSLIPNQHVQEIGRMTWDLVGGKFVQVALGPKVPTLAFSVVGVPGKHLGVPGIHKGFVFIPHDWPELSEKDPFMQLGAILFVGAQIVDYYNDRLKDPYAGYRWAAYEAELLLTFAKILPNWSPNDYQKMIMKSYPEGIRTTGVELYTFKKVETTS